MAEETVITCDHCGKRIKDNTGGIDVRFYRHAIQENGNYLSYQDSKEFNYHDGCAQRVIQAWDELNAGKVEARWQ